MLERVSHFSPVVDEVFVPFAHDEVQVLVCLAGDEDIVRDAFLVVRERAPAVAVQRLEQREARPVQARAGIERRSGEGDGLDAQRSRVGGGRRGEKTKGEVRHGRVVVREDAVRWEEWGEHEHGGLEGLCIGRMRT